MMSSSKTLSNNPVIASVAKRSTGRQVAPGSLGRSAPRNDGPTAANLSPRCGEFRAGRRAQQQQIARNRAQRETARPRRLGARAVETEEARELAMRLGGCDDFGQRGFHFRTVRIDDTAAAQRDREVRGAHEYAVDSRRRDDGVERIERLAG